MSTKVEELDFENIMFSKPKSKAENKFLYVYAGKKPLILKFPKTRLPFGLNKDTLSGKKQFILDVSMEDAPEILERLQELDTFVINKVNTEYYPDLDGSAVRQMYTSCIKTPENPNYKPTFRSKIITKDDQTIKCDFYDSEKNEEGKFPKVNLQENGGESYLDLVMGKGCNVECVMECIGLWFMNGKFGLSFKTIQVKLYPVPKAQKEVCDFLDSDSSDTNSDIDFIN